MEHACVSPFRGRSTPDRTRTARAVDPIGTTHAMIVVLPLLRFSGARFIQQNLRANRKRDVFTSAEGSTSVGAPRRERDSNTRRNRTRPRRFSTTHTRKTPS
jgi:hypothetical protein